MHSLDSCEGNQCLQHELALKLEELNQVERFYYFLFALIDYPLELSLCKAASHIFHEALLFYTVTLIRVHSENDGEILFKQQYFQGKG